MPTNRAVVSSADQIAHLLDQLAVVVETLTDGEYRAVRAREISGSVGGHVRHCLDHVCALVTGLPTRHVGYDARARGTAVERQRDIAALEARRLARALAALRDTDVDWDLDVELRTNATDEAVILVRSTLARELAFVASHTVHHFAIVALLLRDMGIGVPARFGHAPSTPSPELAA